MPVGRDLDIARLEIPVQNRRLAGVQICQCIADRGTDQDRFVFGDVAHALHALPQILALDIVHHQILPLVANHKMIGHARQIGMAQICKDDRLEAELARVFVGGE